MQPYYWPAIPHLTADIAIAIAISHDSIVIVGMDKHVIEQGTEPPL